ncbi:MAG: S1 RNA-binding domain-containing protein [bacterium]|nr:S1 RNA-binding domain-containing protein [bacterium]
MSEFDDINEDMSSEDFEQMLEDSINRTDDFAVGDKVHGTVVFLDNENVFVDISGKSEAVIEISEFVDDDGNVAVKQGDTIEGYISSIGRGEIQLTSRLGKGQINTEVLQIAYESGVPVEGTIIGVVKGGYSVSLSGTRCFCPFSQIDSRAPEKPEDLIQSTFPFRIIKFEERGKNIVLSRRVLLDEERQLKEEELKKSIKEGDVVQGIVKTRRDFGIFVDIGGVEALVPKSELSWSRYSNPVSFKEGDEISGKILSIDWDKKRISMSVKQLSPEPWKNIVNYSEGQSVKGKIVNIIKSGAFLELEPGLEGFIHISRMSHVKRINKPEDVLSIGVVVNAKIVSIDNGERRVALELLTDNPDPWADASMETMSGVHKGIIEISKPTGINVRLDNGMLGFIPRTELAARDNSDIQKVYSVGKEVKFVVKDMSQENKNLILSETGAFKKEEMADYREFQDKNQESEGSTLGNLFKDKFEDLKKNLDK